MTYTIEETDLERQHLLAQFLEPVSLHALKNISLPKQATILDIGCGLGDTTLLLNERFPDSTITGLDGDASLITTATKETTLTHPNLNFVCGDAMQLPFDNNSFDFVFCRYLLHHLRDPLHGIKEMHRVCKTVGTVFALEYDATSIISYPESWAYPKLKDFVTILFADALLGRKMVSYFRSFKLVNICYDAQVILADQNSALKRFYALTAPALGKALLQKNLIDEKGLDEWIKELQRCERDPETIVLMHPTIAVWGTKAEL